MDLGLRRGPTFHAPLRVSGFAETSDTNHTGLQLRTLKLEPRNTGTDTNTTAGHGDCTITVHLQGNVIQKRNLNKLLFARKLVTAYDFVNPSPGPVRLSTDTPDQNLII